MKNYNNLTPKGKFIRTAVCVPVFWAMLIGCWVFFSSHFTLGIGWIIKYVIIAVIIAAVSVWQLVTTYLAWKQDE